MLLNGLSAWDERGGTGGGRFGGCAGWKGGAGMGVRGTRPQALKLRILVPSFWPKAMFTALPRTM